MRWRSWSSGSRAPGSATRAPGRWRCADWWPRHFDHWDTRAGDPNLHTHLVIANKVQGVDGVWRSLDGRRLHKAAVAVSELYDDLIADRLAAVLPVGWSHRDRGYGRTPAFEV